MKKVNKTPSVEKRKLIWKMPRWVYGPTLPIPRRGFAPGGNCESPY